MRKRCKRKVWALIDPIRHAIDGVRVTSTAKLDQVRMLELSSIEAFAKGRATINDWGCINSLLTMVETMSRGGVGPEALETCALAQTTLIESARRCEATQKMGTTGQGLQAFRDLYAWHDLQRTCISLSEYERWIQTSIKRSKSRAPEVVEL